MKILANFTKKISTGDYENETYSVTVETDTEGAFNNISEVSDFLFNQARSAVHRQIEGTANSTVPQTSIPKEDKQQDDESSNGNGNGNGNGHPLTAKQKSLIEKMLREQKLTTQANLRQFLMAQSGVERITDLSRKSASKLIEVLLDRSRGIE
jgi:hypothetical protein